MKGFSHYKLKPAINILMYVRQCSTFIELVSMCIEKLNRFGFSPQDDSKHRIKLIQTENEVSNCYAISHINLKTLIYSEIQPDD